MQKLPSHGRVVESKDTGKVWEFLRIRNELGGVGWKRTRKKRIT